MDKSDRFRNLRFERQPWYQNQRLITVVTVMVVFSLAWWIIPLNFLFFIILGPLGLILWAASYGWRQVLVILLDFLRRLENILSEVNNEHK